MKRFVIASPQGRLPRNDHPTALITSSQHQLLLPLLPPLPPPSPPPRSPRISSHTKVIEKENPSTRSTTIATTSAVATRTTSFPLPPASPPRSPRRRNRYTLGGSGGRRDRVREKIPHRNHHRCLGRERTRYGKEIGEAGAIVVRRTEAIE